MKLKVGDIVGHKVGNFPMLITSAQRYSDYNMFQCMWFTPERKTEWGSFREDELCLITSREEKIKC